MPTPRSRAKRPAPAKTPNWFTYFPENYRWSAAICGMLSNAQWGSANLGEIDQVGKRLAGRVGNDDAWFAEFARMGDDVRKLARSTEAQGYNLSAAAHYRRACTYFQMAERFRTPKDRRALGAYRKSINCFHRSIELDRTIPIEPVEVPMPDGTSLPGYFIPAQNTSKTKPPVLVFFDGLDVTKELQYFRGVPELVRRGISVLIMDGPGTGEAIRFRSIYLRHDYEVAGTAALDYLETRSDVNAKNAGVMAISLGGYYASRIASLEPRYKACVAWGAIWDYHATWKRRIDAAFDADLSVPGHHIEWILNANSLDDALRKLEDFKLDGVVQQMSCPFLVTHGEEDAQIPLSDAQTLYRAVGSKDKTLKIFTAEEGGAQHCQRDNMSLGVTYIADWLADRLKA